MYINKHGVTSSLSLHLLLSHQKLLYTETKIMRLATYMASAHIVAAFSFIFSNSHSAQHGSAVRATTLEDEC